MPSLLVGCTWDGWNLFMVKPATIEKDYIGEGATTSMPIIMREVRDKLYKVWVVATFERNCLRRHRHGRKII
jgi:hypothetical protein